MLLAQHLVQQSIQVLDPCFPRIRKHSQGSVRLEVWMTGLNMHDRRCGRESLSKVFLEPANTALLTDNCRCSRKLHFGSIFLVRKMHFQLMRFYIVTRYKAESSQEVSNEIEKSLSPSACRILSPKSLTLEYSFQFWNSYQQMFLTGIDAMPRL